MACADVEHPFNSWRCVRRPRDTLNIDQDAGAIHAQVFGRRIDRQARPSVHVQDGRLPHIVVFCLFLHVCPRAVRLLYSSAWRELRSAVAVGPIELSLRQALHPFQIGIGQICPVELCQAQIRGPQIGTPQRRSDQERTTKPGITEVGSVQPCMKKSGATQVRLPGRPAAEPARPRLVPNRLDVVRQAAPGHGQPGARAAVRRRRGR